MTRSIDDYFAFNHAALTVKNQRLELIEQRKQEILEKAKTLGYKVKQTEQNGQLRMVLVRRG